MKRVSFEVSKALKEAGYPQIHGMCYYIGVDEFRPMEISRQAYNYNEHISAPYAMDAWLWLWREKEIKISVIPWYDGLNYWGSVIEGSTFYEETYDYNDPEEAIIASIEYLVTNDLIK